MMWGGIATASVAGFFVFGCKVSRLRRFACSPLSCNYLLLFSLYVYFCHDLQIGNIRNFLSSILENFSKKWRKESIL
ncbi:hypothetical protein BHE74_00004145 [Ensete ventricosum]|nr:hypothetical protein GW17_00035116 [Ensete ventricosum]RWW87042.1 hypothetical protein BHE74_00004145 [Ensete ventricosum]RZR81648.1 hypothetical protein BHM03_00007910 [Ensete ventricosum]